MNCITSFPVTIHGPKVLSSGVDAKYTYNIRVGMKTSYTIHLNPDFENIVNSKRRQHVTLPNFELDVDGNRLVPHMGCWMN